MKKFLAIIITIFFVMCFFVAFNSIGVASSKLNKDNIKINSNSIVENNINLEEIHPPKLEKSEDKKLSTDNSQKQEHESMGQKIEGSKHYKKESIETIKNKENKKIDPQKPMIALTFDDGPHPQYTMEIIDALKKYKGSATFFVLGNRAEKFNSVIKSITQNGSQIGNHTYDHKQLTKLSSKAIQKEITKTSDVLQNITNVKPSIIRPTYGSVNDNVKLYSGAPLILWTIDTLDWKNRNNKMIVNAVLGKVKDGDIVLMHDIYKTTAMAAQVIIKELSSQGYQLVTIDELYAARGIDLVTGKVYADAYVKK